MRRDLKKTFEVCIKFIPKYLRVFLIEKIPVLERSSFPGANIKYYCRSRTELYSRRNEWRSEPETIAWINTYLNGGILYDIGANVGTFSLIAASLKKVEKVFSFEPAYPTFLALCENIRVNELGEFIVPCHLAIGEGSGIVKFYFQSLLPGGSCHNLGDNVNWSGNKFQEEFAISMMSCTLDKFIEYFNVPYPNYIKIDVDGIEMKIIKNMSAVLANPELKTLIIEVNNNKAGDFEEIMSAFGFTLEVDFMRKYAVKAHPVTGSINLIFARR